MNIPLSHGVVTALAWFCVTVTCSLQAPSVAFGEDPSHHHSKPYWVEEDWEMVIHEPDVKTNSPQVSFFLYPGGTDERYFQLQMNFAAEEGFSSGGFRVGAFVDEIPVDEERSRVRGVLAWDGDKVEWTSAMAVFDGKLMYALKDGHGLQWGSFGGPEFLVSMPNEHINDLSNYDPQQSLDNVDIGFGSNRVHSIRLKRVRVVYTDGHTQTIDVNLWAH